MFFSINNPNLSNAHEELQEFVLSKEKRGLLEKDFGFYIYIMKLGSMLRRMGITVIGDFYSVPFQKRIVSELSTPPFGLILEFQPKHTNNFSDITYFANEFKYDQKATIKLEMPVCEINTYFPLDCRSRKEIVNDYIKNKIESIMMREQK